MTSTSPPLEAQRFGRSQTPESPRPVHIPEPANIPVLQNQMDPVFNDTSTYNIRPSSQPLSSPARDIPERNTLSHGQSLTNRETVEDFLAAAAANAQVDTPTEPILMSANHNTGLDSLQNASATVDATLATTRTDKIGALYAAEPSHSLLNSASEANREPASSAAQLPAATDTLPSSSTRIQPFASTKEANTNEGVNSLLAATVPPEGAMSSTGVDYQSLLDQITQSASTAPTAESITTATTAAAGEDQGSTERALPTVPGLPPKPPPQDHMPNFPQYSNEAPRYHPLSSPSTITLPSQNQAPAQLQPTNASSGDGRVDDSRIPGAANGFLLSPNVAQSAQGEFPQQFPVMFSPTAAAPGQIPRLGSSGERPWGSDIQGVYDQFLQDERNYVTEGVWDRFPTGSRLFVGNLPTEKVTKRDLFHVFHKYGRLAQISIKQAYGFVQFLEAASCFNALEVEQGVEIRGRKIHLEISKPQRNTRNAGAGGNKSSGGRKRSRSPDRGVARGSMDRTIHTDRVPFSDFRDEPGRKRDDYRPPRSPSPRRYRSRDEYRSRDRSPRSFSQYEARTRSPVYGGGFRPPSPRASDDEAALPIPRRDPREVPDVQILVLEELPQQFINYIEQSFRQKGLRVATIWLNPRITLNAVVKRQIIEGVQAVVKLTRNLQFNSKIPLQVFDRAAGSSNVNFNEYVDLDTAVAADIVIHARQKERTVNQGPVSTPTASYTPNTVFNGQPPYNFPQQTQLPPQYPQGTPQTYAQSQQHQPQYPPQSMSSYRPPSQVSATPNSGTPNLQELLANLRQPSNVQQPPQQSPSQQSNRPTDLAGLLSNVAARQQNQAQAYSQNYQTQQPSLAQYGNQASVQGYTPQQQPAVQGYGTGPQQSQQNVQNVMDQLARFTR